jgi:hypothetical protein
LNIKGFFVDALTSALELGIGTPEDVVRHVTPDVLAKHLPRPLWARLFTACLGASRVDATHVVETIGIPNFCEHVPASIMWACLAEIGARSLGKVPDITVAPAPLPTSTPGSGAVRSSVLAPPPDERPAPPVAATPVAIGPSIPAPTPTAAADQPLADLITELEQDGAGEPRLANLRPRSPTAQRFRQSNTGLQRLGSARRPQAAATPAPTPSTSTRPRREPTEADPDIVTNGGDTKDRGDIAVDDSQLVDWQATDGSGAPAVTDDDFSDLGRKR